MTGRRFRQIRRRLGLSQSQLAKLLGVWPNTVAVWDRGVKPIPGPVELAMNLLPEKNQTRGEKEMPKLASRSAGAHRAHYTRLKTSIVKAREELEKLKELQSVEELPQRIEKVQQILKVQENIVQKALAMRGVK